MRRHREAATPPQRSRSNIRDLTLACFAARNDVAPQITVAILHRLRKTSLFQLCAALGWCSGAPNLSTSDCKTERPAGCKISGDLTNETKFNFGGRERHGHDRVSTGRQFGRCEGNGIYAATL